jgi:hypothetical protein
MFEAQYLITDDEDVGIVVDSPWFPRQGDKIRYTLDLVQAVGATIQVGILHKNSEDTGDGGAAVSTITATSTLGRTGQEFATGLKELVRYQFTVKATGSPLPGYVLFRMLPPVWFDAVAA